MQLVRRPLARLARRRGRNDPDPDFSTYADAGFKTSAAFTVNDGYKRLIAQMSDGTTTGCSTDAFSVRPAPSTRCPAALPAPTKAGAQFTITATPKNPSNTTITSATGSPILDNTKAPVAGGNQTLLAAVVECGRQLRHVHLQRRRHLHLAANAIYDRQFGNAAGEAQDRPTAIATRDSDVAVRAQRLLRLLRRVVHQRYAVGVDSSGKYGCDIGSCGVVERRALLSGSLRNVAGDDAGVLRQRVQLHGAAVLDDAHRLGPDHGEGARGRADLRDRPRPAVIQHRLLAPGTVWFGAQNGTGSTAST